MQLPLLSDPSLMMTKWKAILDPFISGSTVNQLAIGQPQTIVSTTMSTDYVTLTFSPTVTFDATATAAYLISGTFFIENDTTGPLTSVRIFSTLGNPTVLFSQEAGMGQQSDAGNGSSVPPYLLVSLKQSTRYSFALQMRVTSNTGSLRNDIPTNGQVLIARQI